MSTQCGAGSVSAGHSSEITGTRGTLAIFGDGQLRVDPRGVGAGEVICRHGATG
jgi:hypothetical protein